MFWVQVEYFGKRKKWTWFLHPQIDINRNTIKYYAFDKGEQKSQFHQFNKIQGVGPKHAYYLAMSDPTLLSMAVENFDIKYFTNLPWIGQKIAKRILIDLKPHLDKDDFESLAIDEKLLKDILSSLHDLGYERKEIKKLLPHCPHPLKKANLKDIMKRLIDNL